MITRKQIVERFNIESAGLDETQQENLLRELLQEAILCHMKKCGFYEEMAFHGGTSLRILYRIDRYSEDLDFSLIKANENYNYKTALNDMSALVTVEKMEEIRKKWNSAHFLSFLKG